MHGKAWTDLLGNRIRGLMRHVLVAELEGALIGFVCPASFEGGMVVHYIYVEPKFRRHGVGEKMLRHLGLSRYTPCTVTHWTPFVDLFFAKAEWDEGPLQ